MPIGFIPSLENMLNSNRVPEALTFSIQKVTMSQRYQSAAAGRFSRNIKNEVIDQELQQNQIHF